MSQDLLKLRDFEDLDFKEVHDIIFPADVRENDLIRARVRTSDPDLEQQQVRVWKLSPLGVEILVPDASKFKKGEPLEISLQVGKQVSQLQGIIVEIGENVKGLELIVIRLYSSPTPSSPTDERRFSQRWICSSQFYPVAIAPNPSQFNDFIYLTVRDIAGRGMRALTSLRNKFLVQGMILELQISFPMTGYSSINVRIIRTALTAESGKDYLELGLEFIQLTASQRETIGQYLIQFSNADSVVDVKSAGFRPLSFSKGVDFFYIKSQADFQEVLELRLLANKGVGKVPASYTYAAMSDRFDSTSRILAGKFKGKIVGTIRLGFAEFGDRLEVENYVQLPSSFPRRDQIVECSRAVTHPDYRRGDLWYSMIQHIAIATLRANRDFAVISTSKELVPMYKKMGLQEAGITFEMPLYPGVEQHLMYVSVPKAMSGLNVGPVAWAVVWQRVSEFVEKHQIHGVSQMSSIRLNLYRLFGPIGRAVAATASRRTKRQ